MIVIQQTKNHLETCLFLNGQQLTDTAAATSMPAFSNT